MSHTINISETLFVKAQSLADASSQTVDEVIRKLLAESLEQPRLALPQDERDELNALTYLTDATLFTIARAQMPQNKQAQMTLLMDKNNKETLSPQEHHTLTQLVEEGQRLMLRKAEAAKILMSRGHNITLDTFAGDDD